MRLWYWGGGIGFGSGEEAPVGLRVVRGSNG